VPGESIGDRRRALVRDLVLGVLRIMGRVIGMPDMPQPWDADTTSPFVGSRRLVARRL
jgi:hypothetical protein